MKKNVLVTLANKEFINQAKVLFTSAHLNGGWEEDYLLLSFDIPDKNLEWFRKKGIIIKKCKKINIKKIRLFKSSMNKNWTYSVLNKFYLFTPYFKKWDNIIYLDSDMIVKSSINDLKNIKGFNACIDCSNNLKEQFLPKRFIENNKDKEIYKNIFKKYNKKSKPFNSGVMVFNKEIIKNDTFNDLVSITKKIKNIMQLGDQTILNIYFYKKYKPLPLVYNNYIPYTHNKNINSIIIHTPHDLKISRAWEKKSKYYNEWTEILKKSDNVDFKKRILQKKYLNNEEIKLNSKKIKKSINKKLFIKKIDVILHPIILIDRIIGLFGIYIKKRSPNTYMKLKNLNFTKRI
ncbi:MAG: glycosyltransferase [Candidatus Pacearchaeota archaeon]